MAESAERGKGVDEGSALKMATLEDLRRDIDRVDEVLVRLLNERARRVCEIGRLKKNPPAPGDRSGRSHVL